MARRLSARSWVHSTVITYSDIFWSTRAVVLAASRPGECKLVYSDKLAIHSEYMCASTVLGSKRGRSIPGIDFRHPATTATMPMAHCHHDGCAPWRFHFSSLRTATWQLRVDLRDGREERPGV